MILALTCGAAIIAAMPAPATADVAMCNRWTRSCKITSEVDGTRGGSATDNGPRQTQTPDGQDDSDQRVLEAVKKFSAALAEYDHRLADYNRCVLIFDPSLNNAGCGSPPTLPNPPQFSSTNFSGRGNQPTITAGQAAAIAVARLQLPKIAPGIGPPPDTNPWNMAAVGYPLWLWADGPTHVSVRSRHENGKGEGRHLRQDLV